MSIPIPSFPTPAAPNLLIQPCNSNYTKISLNYTRVSGCPVMKKLRIVLLFILVFLLSVSEVSAQNETCIEIDPNKARGTGLISAVESLGKFKSSVACVVSNQIPFSIPNYDKLKSDFYIKSTAPNSTTQVHTETGGNQIYNPSFEAAGTPAANWITAVSSDTPQRSLEIQPVPNGCWSLKNFNSSNISESIVKQASVTVKIGKPYQLTGSIWKSSADQIAFIKAEGVTSCVAQSTVANAWQNVTCPTTYIPQGRSGETENTTIDILAVTGGKHDTGDGRAYFDNIKLTPLETSVSNAPAIRVDPNSTTGERSENQTYLNNISGNSIYNITGNLTIDGTINAPQRSVIVFVDGNLLINQNITYGRGNSNAGFVFIVKGDVRVHTRVTELNGIFVTNGAFCSATNDTTSANCSDVGLIQQLVINGAVISTNSSKPPKFVRRLDENVNPAEKINFEPKYLVMLKDTLSSSQRVFTEVIKPAPIETAITTTAPPPPGSTTQPGSFYTSVPDPGTSFPQADSCENHSSECHGDLMLYSGNSCVPDLPCPSNYLTEPPISSCGSGVADVPPGAIGVWLLNSSSGTTAFDLTLNGNNGTLVNNPVWVTTGKFNNGLVFNGTSQYVRIPNSSSLSPTTAVTVSGWFNIQSLNNITGSFISKRNSYILHPNIDGSVSFYIYRTSGGWTAAVTPANSISLNTWQNWVGTYDGSTVKIYRDGILLASSAASGNLNTSGDLLIGSDVDCNCGTRFLNGLVDEVMVFNKALSLSEIQSIQTGIGITRQYAPGSTCSLSDCTITSTENNCPETCSTSNGTFHNADDPTQFNCSANYLTMNTCSANTGGCISATGVSGGTTTVGREYYNQANSCNPTACPLSSTFNTQCLVCTNGARNSYHDANSCGTITCPYPVTWSSSNFSVRFQFEDNTTDSSGSNNNGTLVNNPSYATGKFGRTIQFSNSNQYLSLSSSIPINNTNYTIASWIQFPLPSATWRTLTRGSSADHQVIVDSGGSLGAYDNGGTGFRSSGYNVNGLTGWHHITAVASGSSTKFFVDGTYVGTSPFKSNSQISYIGNYQGGGQNIGTIDEFRVYLRALSDNEVKALYYWQPGFTAPGSDQCSEICTPTPNQFYNGNSCGKVSCPNNYLNGGTSTQSSCPADGCSSIYGGTRVTYIPTNSCSTERCPLSSTQSIVCGTSTPTNSSVTYTYNGFTMPANGCGIDQNTGNGYVLNYHDGSDNACTGRSCSSANAIYSNQNSCPNNICTPTPGRFHLAGFCTMYNCANTYQASTSCSTADGCTSPAGGSTTTYQPIDTCPGTTQQCEIKSTINRCNEDWVSYFVGRDGGCDGENTTRTYHPDNSCTATNCTRTSTGPTLFSGGANSNNQCPSSCPTPGTTPVAGSNGRYHFEDRCSSVSCPLNAQTGTQCLFGGCTSNCTSSGCGTQSSYQVANVCPQANGSPTTALCNITDTKASVCPKDGSGTYTCYTGADIYYHAAGTCSATSCPHNYLNGGTATTCPNNGTNGCSSIHGGTRSTYIPNNSCSTEKCPLSSTQAAVCGTSTANSTFTYRYNNVTMPANGCGIDSNGNGYALNFHDNSSCDGKSCLTANAVYSNVSSCPQTCTPTPTRYHLARSCTMMNCNNNYKPQTSCTASGCETSSGSSADAPAGGGVQDYQTTANSCTVNNATCDVIDTSSRCTSLGDTKGCTNAAGGGSRITYHDTNTCNTQNCTINSTYSTQWGTACTPTPNTYHDANSCGVITCPNNYPTATTEPGCHMDAVTVYSGSNCGTTAAANCTTFCNSGRTGTRCYVSSQVVYDSALPTTMWWRDTWRNSNGTTTVIDTTGWIVQNLAIAREGCPGEEDNCGIGGLGYHEFASVSSLQQSARDNWSWGLPAGFARNYVPYIYAEGNTCITDKDSCSTLGNYTYHDAPAGSYYVK